jgi:hypothetical protein
MILCRSNQLAAEDSSVAGNPQSPIMITTPLFIPALNHWTFKTVSIGLNANASIQTFDNEATI